MPARIRWTLRSRLAAAVRGAPTQPSIVSSTYIYRTVYYPSETGHGRVARTAMASIKPRDRMDQVGPPPKRSPISTRPASNRDNSSARRTVLVQHSIAIHTPADPGYECMYRVVSIGRRHTSQPRRKEKLSGRIPHACRSAPLPGLPRPAVFISLVSGRRGWHGSCKLATRRAHAALDRLRPSVSPHSTRKISTFLTALCQPLPPHCD